MRQVQSCKLFRSNTKKKLLVNTALNQFKAIGIKSVTMDHLARLTGMSKKTVYQYFSNKKELVLEVVKLVKHQLEEQILANALKSSNAMHELLLQTNVLIRLIELRHVCNEISLRDYPDAIDEMRKFKLNYLSAKVRSNLKDGVVQYLYREDLDIVAATHTYLLLAEALLTQSFDNIDMVMRSMNLFIQGITNSHGLNLYQQYQTINRTGINKGEAIIKAGNA